MASLTARFALGRASSLAASSLPRSQRAVRRRRMATASALVTGVRAREIIDSRGSPTVEVDVTTSLGCYRAAVPSGASTGIHEALELRDGGARHSGKGVRKACANVEGPIAKALIGADCTDQRAIDELLLSLDGTPSKSNLGANAMLGVSLACARAGAAAHQEPLYAHLQHLSASRALVLPVPAFNVINGGSHAGNKLPVQEFMVLPAGASSFGDAVRMGCEVYSSLKSSIKKKYGAAAANVGDEGGFAPDGIQDMREALELLAKAVDDAGVTAECDLAMDVAASEFFKDGKYDLGWKDPSVDQVLSGEEMAAVYSQLVKDFKITSIEDAFDQDDWASWSAFTRSSDVQVVGDDLTVTAPLRIREAIDKGACNALLLKVNQIGTLTEAMDAATDARLAGWGVMVSHRSGETEDSFIADLAVGLAAGQIKSGAPCRSERLSKYNQLLRIEEEIGADAIFAGRSYRQTAKDNAPKR